MFVYTLGAPRGYGNRKWLLASSLFISSILGPVVGVLDVGCVDLNMGINPDTLSNPAGVAGVPLGFRETSFVRLVTRDLGFQNP